MLKFELKSMIKYKLGQVVLNEYIFTESKGIWKKKNLSFINK